MCLAAYQIGKHEYRHIGDVYYKKPNFKLPLVCIYALSLELAKIEYPSYKVAWLAFASAYFSRQLGY